MMTILKKLFVSTLISAIIFTPVPAFAKGKIQNEDIKSLTDITSAVLTTTGNLTSGNACIASPASTTGLATGLFIYDTTTSANIASGTTIAGLPGSCAAGQIQMSANAAGSGTGDTITFGGQASQLINDTKIWLTGLTPNTQLSSALSKGLIGGSGGSKNYLTTYVASNGAGSPNPGNGNFETGATTGWSLAHSALSSLVPTSTGSAGTGFSSVNGGTAANGNLSLSVVSSGQIAGNYSGSLASSASSVAGDLLISSAFNIDTEDQAKMMTIKMYYKVNAGATNLNLSGTSSNSYAVYIYDVTNAAWIQPQGVYNMVQNSGSGYMTGTFQTTSNSTAYQIALVNINASAGSFTLYVDDISVGPQTAPAGPAVTDWVAYTPTFTGFGTVSGISFQSRRVGDSLEVHGVFTTGTVTATQAQISLGFSGANANVTIDSSKINSPVVVGSAVFANSASTLFGVYPIANGANTFLNFGYQASAAAATTVANASSFIGNSQLMAVNALIPISGWSSNSSMSADTDTRVVAARVNGQPTSSITSSPTTVIYPTVQSDTHGAYNATTGVYTVPVSGYYDINAQVDVRGGFTTTSFVVVALYVNGVEVSESSIFGTLTSTTDYYSPFNAKSVKLNAGDAVTIRALSSASTPTYQNAIVSNFFSISRQSGPAVVTATETVMARYTNASSFSVPSNSTTTVSTGWTKETDTHNAFSNGVYTCPTSGTYTIQAMVQYDNQSWTVANELELILDRTGLFTARVALQDFYVPVSSTLYYPLNGSVTVRANAGDTFTVRLFQSNASARTLTGSATLNYFSIVRTGN